MTRLRPSERLGPGERPFASLAECRLETGRTHQIRVHAAHLGHPLVGDPVYGRPRRPAANQATPAQAEALAAFPRQALHAASLGLRHPVSGEWLAFESPLPADMSKLLTILRDSDDRNRVEVR